MTPSSQHHPASGTGRAPAPAGTAAGGGAPRGGYGHGARRPVVPAGDRTGLRRLSGDDPTGDNGDRAAGLWAGAPPAAQGGAAAHQPRLGTLLAGAVLSVLLGAASSTVTTALAVGAAGANADRLFQPVEFAIRVGLLLAAPCMGAVLATLITALVPPRRARLAPWAVGLGVVVGPILALRLDRIPDLGGQAIVAFGALLLCWAVAGAFLAAAAVARTAQPPHDPRPAEPPSRDPGGAWSPDPSQR